jgi:hypothetical protein
MMVGGGSDSRASSLGGLKAGSVEKAVARITGEAVDRGGEGEKKGMVRVRIITRIRGRDNEYSTAYYAYVDGERYVLFKEPTSIIEDRSSG